MEQHRNERTGETGDPRENTLTNGIVRHDSHMRNSGVTWPGIEPGSTWGRRADAGRRRFFGTADSCWQDLTAPAQRSAAQQVRIVVRNSGASARSRGLISTGLTTPCRGRAHLSARRTRNRRSSWHGAGGGGGGWWWKEPLVQQSGGENGRLCIRLRSASGHYWFFFFFPSRLTCPPVDDLAIGPAGAHERRYQFADPRDATAGSLTPQPPSWLLVAVQEKATPALASTHCRTHDVSTVRLRCGAAVAELLACSPPDKTNWVRPPVGSLRIFTTYFPEERKAYEITILPVCVGVWLCVLGVCLLGRCDAMRCDALRCDTLRCDGATVRRSASTTSAVARNSGVAIVGDSRRRRRRTSVYPGSLLDFCTSLPCRMMPLVSEFSWGSPELELSLSRHPRHTAEAWSLLQHGSIVASCHAHSEGWFGGPWLNGGGLTLLLLHPGPGVVQGHVTEHPTLQKRYFDVRRNSSLTPHVNALLGRIHSLIGFAAPRERMLFLIGGFVLRNIPYFLGCSSAKHYKIIFTPWISGSPIGAPRWCVTGWWRHVVKVTYEGGEGSHRFRGRYGPAGPILPDQQARLEDVRRGARQTHPRRSEAARANIMSFLANQILERRSPTSDWYPTRQLAAQPIGNLSLLAVANQARGPFLESRAVNKRIVPSVYLYTLMVNSKGVIFYMNASLSWGDSMFAGNAPD
ncbi:hypothetical protein PR048_001564 [Dryococelus australis]|uniref:Uncharacterized protein n=1 Tax=Dryococelus australis TaxID=614101 RepID=A0ABQ9IHU8_9NEOP|nr:hypothetical protein PR048_001564 [Dryococelus australis]